MARLAVWALGADRPGIVAAVSEVLYRSGCNLEDSSMTILAGHFAMMLLVEPPPDVSPARLEESLRAVGEQLELVGAVREVAEQATASAGGEAYIVSVYGGDRPGIVHRVTALLAAEGVNITDLNTRLVGDPADPVYAMQLEVTLPEGLPRAHVAAALQELGGELGVEAGLHAVDTDIL